MSTYKVIQDIEAEDKLLGPLSLRQFIYAIIVVVMGFIAFKLSALSPLLAIPFLPPMALFGVLAAPFGSEQSSEIWLLAKIRFALKPRKRIWNQSGISELVHITVPKKVEHILTDGLSQTEVRSRLRALANTIDSRGWAVKNINVNLYAQPSYVAAGNQSDRLLTSESLPQEVTSIDVTATDDILDERNNATAQHLDQMITASSQAHRQTLMQQMQQPKPQSPQPQQNTQPADYWFLNATAGQAPAAPTGYSSFSNNTAVLPGQAAPTPASAVPAAATPTVDEQAFLAKKHKELEQTDQSHGHLKTISPLSQKKKEGTKSKKAATPRPQIQQLAQNDDLNISTIARQAKKQDGDDEVVISLR